MSGEIIKFKISPFDVKSCPNTSNVATQPGLSQQTLLCQNLSRHTCQID